MNADKSNFGKNSVVVQFGILGKKRKVPPAYSRADLPIHAKSGRERGPDSTRSPDGRRDDEAD